MYSWSTIHLWKAVDSSLFAWFIFFRKIRSRRLLVYALFRSFFRKSCEKSYDIQNWLQSFRPDSWIVAWSAMAGGLAARMVRETVTVSSVVGGIPSHIRSLKGHEKNCLWFFFSSKHAPNQCWGSGRVWTRSGSDLKGQTGSGTDLKPDPDRVQTRILLWKRIRQFIPFTWCIAKNFIQCLYHDSFSKNRLRTSFWKQLLGTYTEWGYLQPGRRLYTKNRNSYDEVYF